nr:hypothetical protein [Tanacetum cinerariifolium]
MSRLCLSNSHNAFRPSSVRVEPIAIVCSGYFGLPTTLILSSVAWVMDEGCASGLETIMHSIGIILLLHRVSIPLGTRNFNIPPRRIDYSIVMLVLETRGIPLRFGEVQLSLVALNPKLEVFYALSYNQLSGPLVDGRSENLLVFQCEVVQVTLKV